MPKPTIFCFGACINPTKLNYAKVANSATNKGRVSRATAYSTYVQNPRTTAPSGKTTTVSNAITPVISITRIERVSNTQLNMYFSTSLSGFSVLGYGISLNGAINSYGDMSPLSAYGLTLNTNYTITIFAVGLDGSIIHTSAAVDFLLQ